jgi:hypothetical protein
MRGKSLGCVQNSCSSVDCWFQKTFDWIVKLVVEWRGSVNDIFKRRVGLYGLQYYSQMSKRALSRPISFAIGGLYALTYIVKSAFLGDIRHKDI